ncbi:AAA family ATPase [Sphaerisporangium perillae]|uniref:AAA family ATPase n=1 Tax=Sphaerisporangium perillae TaxID=2935860 RepID=UPI002434A441|nr:AAA family ATPase [Sphaerisporangium perillae]
MRLHRLRLTAFGSFPGDEEVDFDVLGEAGLFLVHGPTGAGKTTVLDAVCYALYGQVPGQRNSARRLRCDHAPAGRGPVVVLEVTLRGRRLRITRSPVWHRPKLRGEGLIEEKAKVLLEELPPSGDPVFLSGRADETGDLVGGLLGMNADQFCQVAMLPQGDFARFLRADGDERRKLLEKLFSVKIYSDVERWLSEHRTGAGQERQELRHRVDSVVDHMRGAAGPTLLTSLSPPGDNADAPGQDAPGTAGRDNLVTPAEGDLGTPGGGYLGTSGRGDLGTPGRDAPGPGPSAPDPREEPLEWARALLAVAGQAFAAEAEAQAASEVTLRSARVELESARELAQRQRAHAEAAARRDALDRTADERSDLEAILAEAARADRVLPLVQQAEQRAEAAAKDERLAADAMARALPFIGQPTGSRRASPSNLPARSPGPHRPTPEGTPEASGPDRPTGEPGPERAAGEASPGEPRLEWSGEGGAARSAGEADAERLAELERDRRDEIVRLEQLRPEETRLARVRERLALSGKRLAALTAQEAQAGERLAVLPELRRQTGERLARARLAASGLPAARAAVANATRDLGAVRRRDALADKLATAGRDLLRTVADLPASLSAALSAPASLDASAPQLLPSLSPAGSSGAGFPEASASLSVRLARALSPFMEGDASPGRSAAEVQKVVREVRDRLAGLERAHRDELAGLELRRADEARFAELREKLDALDDRLTDLAQREAALADTRAELPGRLEETLGRLAEVKAEAGLIPAAEAACQAAVVLLDQARRRDALTVELEAADGERRRAVDEAQELRDRLQSIRQARIDGMAAELARGLVPGEPCAVCGSADHPAPASPASSTPAVDDEQAAQALSDAAQEARQAAEGRVAVLSSQLEEATVRAEGLPVEAALAGHDEAEAELARLREVAARAPGLEEEARRAQDALEALAGQAHELDLLTAEHRAQHTGLREELDHLAAVLDAARDGDDSVTARHDRLTEEAGLLVAALQAATRTGEAAAAYEESRAAARRTHAPHTEGPATASGPVVQNPHGDLGDAGPAEGLAGGEAGGVGAIAEGAEGVGRGGLISEGVGEGRDEIELSLAEAEEALRGAEVALAELREVAGGEAALVEAAGRIDSEIAELGERATRIGLEIAAERAGQTGLAADAEQLAARLDEARGPDATLAARLERLTDEAGLLREAAETARLARAAGAERNAALARAESAAVDAGFSGMADVRAATRTAAARDSMAERLRELDAERAAVAALLADPQLVAAAAMSVPDLAALAEAFERAERGHAVRGSARDQAAARRDQLRGLATDLEAALAEWRPAEDRYRLAKRLAELAVGTSPDNTLDMRLSSYVLGERLRQVVDAANQRLDHMSAGRYSLLYDVRKSAADRKRSGGGLGLRVLDGWTGADRDPVTLSGGEAFMASLALALALADVVTAEAGGVELGTLFIDEGFGTLDEDTLDGVLDILDELRDGGRAVGIVSHVGELRARVPAQLKVVKQRFGSSLSVAVPA